MDFNTKEKVSFEIDSKSKQTQKASKTKERLEQTIVDMIREYKLIVINIFTFVFNTFIL